MDEEIPSVPRSSQGDETSTPTPQSTASARPEIEELDSVLLKFDVACEGIYYPAGTWGVAVYKHRGGEAFEVELFEPEPAVVTLRGTDLKLVARAP